MTASVGLSTLATLLANVQLNVGRNETIGWGTLSLINAGLAQTKNRSGFGWFLISLLLGPIATFLLVALCEKLEPSRPEV